MSRVVPSLLTLLALAACGGKDAADTGGTFTSTGTATSTGTDTSGGDVFSFALDGAVEDAALALFAIDYTAGMEPGAALLAAAVSGGVAEVPRAVPDAGALVPFPENTALSFALYAPLLWRDADGDLVRDDDEPFLGSGRVVMAYFDDVDEALLAEGYRPGWNALELSMEGERPTAVALDDLHLPLNLVVAESLTLSGTADGTLGDGVHVVVLGSDGQSAPDRLLADVPATGTWTLTVSGAPDPVPTDPFLQLQATSGLYGLVTAWTDTDGSGAYSAGDAILPVCAEGGPPSVTALWINAVTDGGDAVMMGFMGLGAGWRLMTADSGGLTSVDAATPLLASTRCGSP
jgi:hypothetical protein